VRRSATTTASMPSSSANLAPSTRLSSDMSPSTQTQL
jgi:hypothetical protein